MSKDLVDWVDVDGWQGDNAAAIVPGPGAYDSLGIFSGTAHSVNLKGEQDGTLLAFYTSVSALPTAWNVCFFSPPFIFLMAYSGREEEKVLIRGQLADSIYT